MSGPVQDIAGHRVAARDVVPALAADAIDVVLNCRIEEYRRLKRLQSWVTSGAIVLAVVVLVIFALGR